MSHHLSSPLTLNQPLIKVENGLKPPFYQPATNQKSGPKIRGSSRIQTVTFEPFGKRREEFVPPWRDEGRKAERAGASESNQKPLAARCFHSVHSVDSVKKLCVSVPLWQIQNRFPVQGAVTQPPKRFLVRIRVGAMLMSYENDQSRNPKNCPGPFI